MMNTMDRSNGEKRTVLMVSYAYPPEGMFLASLRLAKFAKYLPDYGWEPVILCASGAYTRCGLANFNLADVETVRARDFFGTVARLTGIASASHVRKNEMIRSRHLSSASGRMSTPSHSDGVCQKAKGFLRRQRDILLGKLFTLVKVSLIPDHLIMWYPSATRSGYRTLRNRSIDAIYSTSPQFTNHLVGGCLARRFKLPWVADFRDRWTTGPLYSHGGWRRRLDERIERSVLRQANRIAIVSEADRGPMSAIVSGAAEKIRVIPNGFDNEDLAGLTAAPQRDRFVLTYCGEFYGGKRNPEGLLRAIGNLKASGNIHSQNFTFTIIGGIDTQVVKLVDRFGVSDVVEFANYMPHRDALARMANSTVGVVITMTDQRSRGEMTTKFYEYLGLRRPILALTPQGFELARITEMLGVGTAIDPNDFERVEAWLREQICSFERNGPPPNLEETKVMQFSRAATAGKLAVCLNEIVGATS
jgi:glycosyltransferase involved in cell wall biosynthesis